ncbi:TIGR03089 family protein [Corynebacterium sp. HMSC28B08]|uniref:TIGR03089 family protein n=1 Tax=Corynebacterium sp. HMSC28B08 TaxID=1581066 RepID=UPI000A42827B|nr:TIGR03089 family protein [Corynebacterium sp. HMSC28B08]
MDFLSELLSDPATPRLTTYTTHGRMELSAQTLANWQAKVANLLTGIGAQPGDVVVLAASASWQPAVIALGAWKVGCAVVSSFAELTEALRPAPSVPDATPAPTGRLIAVFTDDADIVESDEATDAEEIYLLSNDPFGRGVEESGGDVPFGVNDFSPELRVQPDAFMGLDIPRATSDGLFVTQGLTAGKYLARARSQWAGEHPNAEVTAPSAATSAPRAAFSPWADTQGLAVALEPLAAGGSTVMVDTAGVSDLTKVLESEKVTANTLES